MEWVMTEWFIRRPIGSSLLMVSLVVAGILGYSELPVDNIPELDFPTLVVTANAGGASATYMERAVTNPLEEKLANIPGIESMRSTSAQNSTTIVVRFRLGRDMNEAANQAQAAMDEAKSALSPGLENPPVLAKFNPADQPVLLLSLRSNTLPLWELNDLAQRTISPRLGTIPGVAKISVLGSSDKALRLLYSPVLLNGHHLGPLIMESRLKAANSNLPAGSLDGPVRSVQLENLSMLKGVDELNLVPLRSRDEGLLLLSDIGEVKESSFSTTSKSTINQAPGIVVAVRHSPNANSLKVVRSVRDLLPFLQEALPGETTLEVLADASQPVGESIKDLQITLLVAIGLVVLVTVAFLGDIRSTLVTSLVVPASLAGTLGFMWLMSYTLDNFSLLALTLAVSFVVDDAVVVLENSHRLVGEGIAPLQAAITGARQISFTILSMTLSLVAVFLPVLLMGGVVGRLFHEFAIILSFAILLSGVIALFFTPMVCALLLRPAKNHGLEKPKISLLTRIYLLTLKPVIAAPWVFMLLGAITVYWTLVEFNNIPKGFVPADDENRLIVLTRVQAGTSSLRMAEAHQRMEALLQKDPAVERQATLLGINEYNHSVDFGCILLQLRPKKERGPIQNVRDRLMLILNTDPEMMAKVVQPPSIPLATELNPASIQFTLQALDGVELITSAQKLVQAMRKSKKFSNIPGNLDLGTQGVRVLIDGRMCGLLGIDPASVNQTLKSAYADNSFDTVFDRNGSYKLIVLVNPEFQKNISQIGFLQVPSRKGQLINLSQITSIESVRMPTCIYHTNRFLSRTFSFDPAPGVPNEEAIAEIKRLAASTLDPDLGVRGAIDGVAIEYSQAAKGFPPLLLFALLVIYLILGILYESFVHPVTVISGLPSACLGGLLVLRYFGMELDLYGFLGLLLLLGIVKKNAIMVIDFAIDGRRAGLQPKQAIEKACATRLRPIMMTTVAAIVGALPIALGWGAGAESRQPIGLVVVGGLIFSQLITLYLTPAVYLCLSRLERTPITSR